VIEIDGFINSYSELKSLSKICQFQDIENPYDGVIYPSIFMDIPNHIREDIGSKLFDMFGEVKINALFMRMSQAGVHVPHMAHTDNSMGDYSLMLYLFDNPGSGTAMLKHKASGIAYAPEDENYLDGLIEDMNSPGAWDITDIAVARENKALIFKADRFHCALPVGGFGETQEDARIVLTAFFEVIND